MSKKNNGFTYKDGITLKEYFDEKFRAADKALMLYNETMDKRLEGMNEFREALKDQTAKFITRV
jgi:hypothetical protein